MMKSTNIENSASIQSKEHYTLLDALCVSRTLFAFVS